MDIDGEDSGSDDNDSILNVDFEFFDPQPDVDFHGLKTLLRQLFDVDNDLFDLSELSDMILAQPLLGSTVKCEGNESDPFAFLTVLNMHQHREKAVIQELTKYLLSRSATVSQQQHDQLKTLLDPQSEAQVGLILTERFINMPAQLVPPMYNMLLEEMDWALEEKEPYQFSHYLIVSKTYTEVDSKLDAEEDRPGKKAKKAAAKKDAETFYFHAEDEVLKRNALTSWAFEYQKQGEDGASDAKRAFQEAGVRPQGLAMLIEGGKFKDSVKAVGEYLGSGTEAA
ncbi:hypothetical protein MBLNU230_g1698t1 [Neophaeotheca triangularis]